MRSESRCWTCIKETCVLFENFHYGVSLRFAVFLSLALIPKTGAPNISKAGATENTVKTPKIGCVFDSASWQLLDFTYPTARPIQEVEEYKTICRGRSKLMNDF